MKTETFTIDGNEYTVRIGRNAQNNWDLIDMSEPTDLWFHLENEASCHLVLRSGSGNAKSDRKIIRRCAYLCKINSKTQGNKKTAVIYAPIESIEKTDKIGQVYVKNSKTVYV